MMTVTLLMSNIKLRWCSKKIILWGITARIKKWKASQYMPISYSFQVMVLLSLPISPSLFICLNLLEYHKPWSKYMEDPKDLSPRFTDKMRGQLATVFYINFCLLCLFRFWIQLYLHSSRRQQWILNQRELSWGQAVILAILCLTLTAATVQVFGLY
jgi:hypothetical protein